MSAPDAAALLELTVQLGLGAYLDTIPDPELALLRQITESAEAARRAGLTGERWPAQRRRLAEAWGKAEGVLARLLDALALGEIERFLLGLAVAAEQRRTTALALAILQAPAATSRPTLHLALEIAETLFGTGAGDTLAVAASPLFEAGLLGLEGADVLPHRALALQLPLWRALAGGGPAWPGCAPLSSADTVSLPPSFEAAAQAVVSGEVGGIVLRGPPGSGRAPTAAAIASRLGLRAMETPHQVFREDRAYATACRAARWLPVLRLAPEPGESVIVESALPVIVLAGNHGAIQGDRLIELALAPPPLVERLRLWDVALGHLPHALDRATLGAAVLIPAAITAIARDLRIRAEADARPATTADLAESRLTHAPGALGRLAHPIRRQVGAEALIAGPQLAHDLAALIERCRRRETVWDGLGPSLAAGTTRGVRALFAGESGTGKTMAASHVATALGAPLFRCDLAAVMNKYIGESEKNLGALLDHAEAADIVLLIDEADALFGRRSDGGETGERYANMLTNYLLTRLEAHHGIVILTSNAKARIDPAFWRRLDHVVDFPLPAYEERLALWRSHLGARAPADAVLERLAAYCDLPGGGVRNAVLAAAAIAPGTGPIGLDCLTPALQREYAKLRRILPAGLALAMRAAE